MASNRDREMLRREIERFRVSANEGFVPNRPVSPRAGNPNEPVGGHTWVSRELKGSRIFPLLLAERCKFEYLILSR